VEPPKRKGVRIKDDLNLMRQNYLASKSVDSRSVNSGTAQPESRDVSRYPMFDSESDDDESDEVVTRSWIDPNTKRIQTIATPNRRPLVDEEEREREPAAAAEREFTKERERLPHQSVTAVRSNDFHMKATMVETANPVDAGASTTIGYHDQINQHVDSELQALYRSIVL
jgi:hypothetical protein